MTLGDVLSDDQLRKMEQIYQDCGGDVMKMIGKCKIWFKEPEMVKQLYQKGLVSEFAAYSLPFHYAKAKRS